MRFNADRFAFGRHETFHLRFAFLVPPRESLARAAPSSRPNH